MRSGFLITPEPRLDLCGTQGVRYAAALDDGRGLAAYDVDTLAEVFELSRLGFSLSEIPGEQQGDAEELLRRLGRGPKRQTPHGDERFVIYDVLDMGTSAFRALEAFRDDRPRGACVVAADPETLYILVETGPEWDCPIPAVWDCVVTEYRDVRLLAAAAP